MLFPFDGGKYSKPQSSVCDQNELPDLSFLTSNQLKRRKCANFSFFSQKRGNLLTGFQINE
jgi:hypothetical protein